MREWLMFKGLMIGGALHVDKGAELWRAEAHDEMFGAANFGSYMSRERFTQIFEAASYCKSKSVDVSPAGDWGMWDNAVREWNRSRQLLFTLGSVLVMDESMSAWCPLSSREDSKSPVAGIIYEYDSLPLARLV